MSSFWKFLLGILMGSLFGAILGFLLAPRRGAETRRMIREEFDKRYRDSRETVQENAHLLKEKAQRLSEELEETGRRVVRNFSDAHRAETAETVE